MFAAMTICLAFVKVPPAALPLKAVDVDWREMGLVDTIRLRANRIPSDVSWTVRSLPEEEDVAWHEMGFVNGVRVVKPRRAKAKLTRPAQIARPLKPMRKKLELPNLGEEMNLFTQTQPSRLFQKAGEQTQEELRRAR